jgi:hypothetical protein
MASKPNALISARASTIQQSLFSLEAIFQLPYHDMAV